MHSWYVVKFIFYSIALLLFIAYCTPLIKKWLTHVINLVFTNVCFLFRKFYVTCKADHVVPNLQIMCENNK